jgi:predicted AlkP superfamily phosphohydrolase/phosphomutase
VRRSRWVFGFWTLLVGPSLLACLGGGDEGEVVATTKPVGLPPKRAATPPGSGSGSGVAEKKVQVGDPRVVVLVFDGVDPDWVDSWRTALTHIDQMVGSATQVRRLRTVAPPASPVVWASFGTSRPPDKHGVFGSVVRDPLTYLPRPGDLELRLDGENTPAMTSYRSGTPFWEVAASAGVPTKVLFAPYAFPIRDVEGLKLVAGEGTPDLLGTWGTYTVFDTQPTKATRTSGTMVRLRSEGGTLTGSIPGPGDAEIPVSFEPRPPDRVSIHVGSEGTVLDARIGDFTPWTPVTFTVGATSIRGKTRFFPIVVGPRTHVYASPVVIDPAAPYVAVSTPSDWAKQLVDAYGEIKLLGWEHETQGWTDGVVPAEVFVRDRSSLNKIRRQALLGELEQNDGTRLVVAFDHDADRVWHALSAQVDRSSKAYVPEVAGSHGPLVKESYVDIDLFVGEVVERLGPKDRLILVSGNGFHSWQWEVHLDGWLRDQGYLALAKDAPASAQIGGRPGTGSEEAWTWDIDWARTKAYAVGGGAIYLNLEGREAHGSVPPDEASALASEIEKKLLAWEYALQSSKTKVVTEVRNRVAETERSALEPDLQVGFASGFGASRATWSGLVPAGPAIVRNTQIWYGDHATNAASDTAGFALGNSKTIPADASLLDVGPTVLSLVGVEKPADYEGKTWP